MKQLHLKEMKEAAIAAKEKYLEDHPECADIDMKFVYYGYLFCYVIYLCVKIS
jgi:hypothetical protein